MTVETGAEAGIVMLGGIGAVTETGTGTGETDAVDAGWSMISSAPAEEDADAVEVSISDSAVLWQHRNFHMKEEERSVP